MDFEANKLNVTKEEKNREFYPPDGWFTPEEIVEVHKTRQQEKNDESFVLNNLPLATARAEKLVKEIEKRTNVKVPETYMRVADDTSFHFMLLVDLEAFHSPEMAVAHILAEEYTIGEEGFDVHFTFSVLKEFTKRSLSNSDKYDLKWLNDSNE